MTDLALVARRFRALHASFLAQASTRTLHAGFASVYAALEAAEESARADATDDPPTAIEHVQCPRCLVRTASRADVEAVGTCFDCYLAARPQEPPSRDAAVSPSSTPAGDGGTV